MNVSHLEKLLFNLFLSIQSKAQTSGTYLRSPASIASDIIDLILDPNAFSSYYQSTVTILVFNPNEKTSITNFLSSQFSNKSRECIAAKCTLLEGISQYAVRNGKQLDHNLLVSISKCLWKSFSSDVSSLCKTKALFPLLYFVELGAQCNIDLQQLEIPQMINFCYTMIQFGPKSLSTTVRGSYLYCIGGLLSHFPHASSISNMSRQTVGDIGQMYSTILNKQIHSKSPQFREIEGCLLGLNSFLLVHSDLFTLSHDDANAESNDQENATFQLPQPKAQSGIVPPNLSNQLSLLENFLICLVVPPSSQRTLYVARAACSLFHAHWALFSHLFLYVIQWRGNPLPCCLVIHDLLNTLTQHPNPNVHKFSYSALDEFFSHLSNQLVNSQVLKRNIKKRLLLKIIKPMSDIIKQGSADDVVNDDVISSSSATSSASSFQTSSSSVKTHQSEISFSLAVTGLGKFFPAIKHFMKPTEFQEFVGWFIAFTRQFYYSKDSLYSQLDYLTKILGSFGILFSILDSNEILDSHISCLNQTISILFTNITYFSYDRLSDFYTPLLQLFLSLFSHPQHFEFIVANAFHTASCMLMAESTIDPNTIKTRPEQSIDSLISPSVLNDQDMIGSSMENTIALWPKYLAFFSQFFSYSFCQRQSLILSSRNQIPKKTLELLPHFHSSLYNQLIDSFFSNFSQLNLGYSSNESSNSYILSNESPLSSIEMTETIPLDTFKQIENAIDNAVYQRDSGTTGQSTEKATVKKSPSFVASSISYTSVLDLIPENARDIHLAIHFTQFFKRFILTCHPELFLPHITPFLQLFIPLSNKYPLISCLYTCLHTILVASQNLYYISSSVSNSSTNAFDSGGLSTNDTSFTALSAKNLEENQKLYAVQVFTKSIATTCSRMLHFQDELLTSALEYVLAAPNYILNYQILHQAISRALKTNISLSYLAVKTFIRWIDQSQQCSPRALGSLLDLFGSFLHHSSSKSIDLSTIASQDSLAQMLDSQVRLKAKRRAKRQHKSRITQKKYGLEVKERDPVRKSLIQVDSETQIISFSDKGPLASLQLEILRLFGQLGGKSHLLFMNKSIVTTLSTSWDSFQKKVGSMYNTTTISTPNPAFVDDEQQILDNFTHIALIGASKFQFHIGSKRLKINLVQLIPRLAFFCLNSSIKAVKTIAVELFHSIILFLVGQSATNASGGSNRARLLGCMFPVAFRLGIDYNPVVRQLFRPLCFQLVHWYSKTTPNTFGESTVFLDSCITDLCRPNKPYLTSFMSLLLVEFFKWSLKHSPDLNTTTISTGDSNSNPVSTKKLFRRIFSLLEHSSPNTRFGAISVLNSMYKSFRENPTIVDLYTCAILHHILLSLLLNKRKSQHPVTQQSIQALRHYEKIAVRYSPKLGRENPGRSLYPLGLGQFCQWLWNHCFSKQLVTQNQATRLFKSLCPLLPNLSKSFLSLKSAPSTAHIQNHQNASLLEWLRGMVNNHSNSWLNQSLSNPIIAKSRPIASDSEQQQQLFMRNISSFCSSIEWIFSFIPPRYLDKQMKSNNLFSALNFFIQEYALHPERFAHSDGLLDDFYSSLSSLFRFLATIFSKFHAYNIPEDFVFSPHLYELISRIVLQGHSMGYHPISYQKWYYGIMESIFLFLNSFIRPTDQSGIKNVKQKKSKKSSTQLTPKDISTRNAAMIQLVISSCNAVINTQLETLFRVDKNFQFHVKLDIKASESIVDGYTCLFNLGILSRCFGGGKSCSKVLRNMTLEIFSNSLTKYLFQIEAPNATQIFVAQKFFLLATRIGLDDNLLWQALLSTEPAQVIIAPKLSSVKTGDTSIVLELDDDDGESGGNISSQDSLSIIESKSLEPETISKGFATKGLVFLKQYKSCILPYLSENIQLQHVKYCFQQIDILFGILQHCFDNFDHAVTFLVRLLPQLQECCTEWTRKTPNHFLIAKLLTMLLRLASPVCLRDNHPVLYKLSLLPSNLLLKIATQIPNQCSSQLRILFKSLLNLLFVSSTDAIQIQALNLLPYFAVLKDNSQCIVVVDRIISHQFPVKLAFDPQPLHFASQKEYLRYYHFLLPLLRTLKFTQSIEFFFSCMPLFYGTLKSTSDHYATSTIPRKDFFAITNAHMKFIESHDKNQLKVLFDKLWDTYIENQMVIRPPPSQGPQAHAVVELFFDHILNLLYKKYLSVNEQGIEEFWTWISPKLALSVGVFFKFEYIMSNAKDASLRRATHHFSYHPLHVQIAVNRFLSILFGFIPTAVEFQKHLSPIVAQHFNTPTNATQLILKQARQRVTNPIPSIDMTTLAPDSPQAYLCTDFHHSAYQLLGSLPKFIINPDTRKRKPGFLIALFFMEHIQKNRFFWRNVVPFRSHDFPAETSFLVIHGKSDEKTPKKSRNQFNGVEYLTQSSLGFTLGSVENATDDVFISSSIFDAESSSKFSQNEPFELDCINALPVMQTVLSHLDYCMSPTQIEHDSAQKLAKYIFQSFIDAGNPPHVRLFLAKLILNRPQVFESYIFDNYDYLLKFVYSPYDNGGVGIHYFLRDWILQLAEWSGEKNLVETNKDSQASPDSHDSHDLPDHKNDNLSSFDISSSNSVDNSTKYSKKSKFICKPTTLSHWKHIKYIFRYLISFTWNEKSSIRNSNLALLDVLVNRWKNNSLSIPYDLIYEYFAYKPITPQDRDRAFLVMKTGFQILSIFLHAGYPIWNYDDSFHIIYSSDHATRKWNKFSMWKKSDSNLPGNIQGFYSHNPSHMKSLVQNHVRWQQFSSILLKCLSSSSSVLAKSSARCLGYAFKQNQKVSPSLIAPLQEQVSRILDDIYRQNQNRSSFLEILERLVVENTLLIEKWLNKCAFLIPSLQQPQHLITVLKLFHWYLENNPNEFSIVVFECIRPQLKNLVASRNESLSLILISLLSSIVQNLAKQGNEKAVLNIITTLEPYFTIHIHDECRKKWYQLLFDTWTAGCAKEQAINFIVVGCSDSSIHVRNIVYDALETFLPNKPLELWIQLFQNMYKPQFEDRWVHFSAAMILKLSMKHQMFTEHIFPASITDVLGDVDYQPLSLINFAHTNSAPLFTASFNNFVSNMNQIDQPNRKNLVKATPQNLIFSQTIAHKGHDTDPNKQSYSQLDSLISKKFNQSFLEPKESFTQAQSPAFQSASSLSSGMKFGVVKRFTKLGKLVTQQRHIRYAKNLNQKQNSYSKYRKLSKFGDSVGQTTVYRSYRTGELPDIQISFADIIRPLMALVPLDDQVATLVFTQFHSQLSSGKDDVFSPLLNGCLYQSYGSEMHSSPTFVRALFQCFPRGNTAPVDVVTNLASLSDTQTDAICVLENQLIPQLDNSASMLGFYGDSFQGSSSLRFSEKQQASSKESDDYDVLNSILEDPSIFNIKSGTSFSSFSSSIRGKRSYTGLKNLAPYAKKQKFHPDQKTPQLKRISSAGTNLSKLSGNQTSYNDIQHIETWQNLSLLYQDQHLSDIVYGLITTRLSFLLPTKSALKLQLNGQYQPAFNTFCELLINKENEAAFYEKYQQLPGTNEFSIWEQGKLYCALRLCDWNSVEISTLESTLSSSTENLTSQMLQKLWQPKFNHLHLPLWLYSTVQTALQFPIHENNSKSLELFLGFMNPGYSTEKEPPLVPTIAQRKSMLQNEYSDLLGHHAYFVKESPLEAKTHLGNLYSSLLKKWSNPSADRSKLLANVQKAVEFEEFLSVSNPSDAESLVNRWSGRDINSNIIQFPLDTRDFNDILLSRHLYFQHFSSIFPSIAEQLHYSHFISYIEAADSLSSNNSISTALKHLSNAKELIPQIITMWPNSSIELEFANYRVIIRQIQVMENSPIIRFIHSIKTIGAFLASSKSHLRLDRSGTSNSSNFLKILLSLFSLIHQTCTHPSFDVNLFDKIANLGDLFETCIVGDTNLYVELEHHLEEISLQISSHTIQSDNSIKKIPNESSDQTEFQHNFKDPKAAPSLRIKNFLFHCCRVVLAYQTFLPDSFDHQHHQHLAAFSNSFLEFSGKFQPLLQVYLIQHTCRGLVMLSRKSQNMFPKVFSLLLDNPQLIPTFLEAVRVVPLWVFLPWINQFLAYVNSDIGEVCVVILEALAVDYPQAVYWPLSVSSEFFNESGLARSARLRSFLYSPLHQVFKASLNDLTEPVHRLGDFGEQISQKLVQFENLKKAYKLSLKNNKKQSSLLRALLSCSQLDPNSTSDSIKTALKQLKSDISKLHKEIRSDVFDPDRPGLGYINRHFGSRKQNNSTLRSLFFGPQFFPDVNSILALSSEKFDALLRKFTKEYARHTIQHGNATVSNYSTSLVELQYFTPSTPIYQSSSSSSSLLYLQKNHFQHAVTMQLSFPQISQLLNNSIDKLYTLSPCLAYIEIPGQYEQRATGNILVPPQPQQHTIITSIDPKMTIMSSIRRPKAISFRGSDELQYKYLVKGGEDLRLDERIEQLFGTMNSIFQSDIECAKRQLSIFQYQIIPLSPRLGVLQWVENSATLKGLINDSFVALKQEQHLAKIQESRKNADNLNDSKLGVGGRDGVKPKNTKISLHDVAAKHYFVSSWLKNDTSAISYIRGYTSKTRNQAVEAFAECQKRVPWDLLKRALFNLCHTPRDFIQLRSTFARSLGVISIATWTLGIGDRHLDNFMINTHTGCLVPIDFGHAFGSATTLLPIPEMIPFRMTTQMTNALLPLDTTGLLKSSMTKSLSSLIQNSELLLQTMNVFIQEPLLDWIGEATKNVEKQHQRLDDMTDSELEATVDLLKWLPESKIAMSKQKLSNVNPRKIFQDLLQQNRPLRRLNRFKEINALIRIAQGTPENDFRARIGDVVESVDDYVDCLINMATDPNILMRLYAGWAPWI